MSKRTPDYGFTFVRSVIILIVCIILLSGLERNVAP
jgi:hypothetical protein